MKYFKVVSSILFLSFLAAIHSCFPDFSSKESDKLYLKIINIPHGSISWFTYSAAYANSPDYVVLKLDSRTDTICKCDNILDVTVIKSNITIKSNGRPSLYNKATYIPKTIDNFVVFLDTTYTGLNPVARRYFKLSSK